MIVYDPHKWYWLADDGRVFSGPSGAVVSRSDRDYIAWTNGGNRASRWPVDDAGQQTGEALQQVLTPYGLYVDPADALRAWAAAARFIKETNGITVGTVPIATDRDSQDSLNRMWAAAQMNPAIAVSFKSSAGFVAINAAQIQTIASAVVAHVQACFAAEAQVVADITSGKITATAQIDAAFAAVTA